MFRWTTRSASSLALLLAFLSSAAADPREDYRQFFKPPDTVQEYWSAVKFEMELGAYQAAAQFLKGFMDKNPAEKDILAIEEKDGMSAFLALRIVPKWSDDPKLDADTKKRVEDLIQSVTNIVKAARSNPERIAKLVGLLSATEGERVYAIKELRRSGADAVPQLIKELREAESSDKFTSIVGALPYLGRDAVPGLLAALQINDPVLRAGLIDGIRKRTDLLNLTRQWDTNPIPHLWHLAVSPKHPEYVRNLASGTLAVIYNLPADKLPPARTELTREANRYYTHKVRFLDPRNVTVWHVVTDKQELTMEPATASRAEEVYGLHFAQLALDLDPAYEPAQVVALSIATDKGLEAAGLGQPLSKSPKLKELLSTVNADLLNTALARALDEQRTAVALGTIRALGDRMDIQAARPVAKGVPSLVRALNYSDRRVQFAAVDALLRLPGPPPPQATVRAPEVLRRIVQGDAVSKVIIADFNQDRGLDVAKAVKEAGYEPIVVQTGRQLLDRLRESADVDAILIDHQIQAPLLRTLLPQLRADIDMAQLPLIVTIPPLPEGVRPPDSVIPLQRMVEPYRNVFIVDASNNPEVLKPLLDARIAAAMGKPLSDEERKATQNEAMVWLKRLAVGEVPGYGAAAAEPAIIKALRNEELNALAVEAAGRLRSRTAQRELANLVLDEAVRAEVRASAAVELARNVQLNRLVLAKSQIVGLQSLFGKTEDGRLKQNVAVVLGALRPDAYRTGDRIKAFTPEPPGAAKPEPGKEKMDKDKMDKEKMDKDKKDKEDKDK